MGDKDKNVRFLPMGTEEMFRRIDGWIRDAREMMLLDKPKPLPRLAQERMMFDAIVQTRVGMGGNVDEAIEAAKTAIKARRALADL